MAHGELDFAEIPFRYKVRHLPRGRKQAVLNGVQDSLVARIPSWTAEEAPLVAELNIAGLRRKRWEWNRHEARVIETDIDECLGFTVPHSEATVNYRIARTGDNQIHLMASASSLVRASNVFKSETIPRADQDFIRYEMPMLPIFLSDKSWDWYAHQHFNPLGPELGKIITSGRETSLQIINQTIRKFALIDGELWIPSAPPGWNIHIKSLNPEVAQRVPGSLIISAVPDPRSLVGIGDGCNGWGNGFLPFDRDAIGRFIESNPALAQLPLPPMVSGGITTFIPEALVEDIEWQKFRRATLSILESNIDPRNLMEEENKFRSELKQTIKDWPEEREQTLVRQSIALARAVHGVMPSGNVETLRSVLSAATELRNSMPLPPLEYRLRGRGIEIPALPEPPGMNLDFVDNEIYRM